MTDRTCRIHELAALAGVSVKTLRHYDRVGLLQPRRTAARCRLYTEADRSRLQQTLALRSLGQMDATTWLQVADFIESAMDRPAG